MNDADIDRFFSDRAGLFERSLDPMLVGRFDGHLAAVNGAYQHLVGMKLDEISTELDLTGRWEGELRRRCSDGRYIVVLSRWASRTGVGDNLVDILEIDSDITARKDAEDHRAMEAEELSRSNSDLEQFASVVSHDLFQPLGAIGFYADLLAGAHGDPLDEDAKEFVARIQGGVRHMRDLIRDLLVYGRAGHGNLNKEGVDCNRLVESVLKNLQVALADAFVEVGELPVVQADAIQLAQTFQNLIDNAAKYARPGVRPEISVMAERGDGVVRFCVTDNGAGIAPEKRKLIFDAFERVDPAADTDGTGMGLAICARVVARHGGRIWVEDAPAQGSRFYFTLPA